MKQRCNLFWRSELSCLETTRTSITRLKPFSRQFHFSCVFLGNDKNLDYEIETPYCSGFASKLVVLETTRTSITRLKPVSILASRLPSQQPWNDKNLDYEIETSHLLLGLSYTGCYLKRQEPRLRDWNHRIDWPIEYLRDLSLKRQEPRLRDWNLLYMFLIEFHLRPWNDKNLDYEIETYVNRVLRISR